MFRMLQKKDDRRLRERSFMAFPAYFVIALAEWAVLDVFAWAGFSWRNPSMEYTSKGRLLSGIISALPAAAQLLVFSVRYAGLYRRRRGPVKAAAVEAAVCLAGIFTAAVCYFFVLSFDLLPKPLADLRRLLLTLIEQSDWMQWPPP